MAASVHSLSVCFVVLLASPAVRAQIVNGNSDGLSTATPLLSEMLHAASGSSAAAPYSLSSFARRLQQVTPPAAGTATTGLFGGIGTGLANLMGGTNGVFGLRQAAAPAAGAAAPGVFDLGGLGGGLGNLIQAPPVLVPAPMPEKPVLAGNTLIKPAKVQEAALLAVKASLDPKGQVLADWNPAVAPYCKWINVVCDEAGNVVRLTISYLALDGTLPPATAITNLPGLKGLLLGGNALKGTLPAGYGASASLQELYLNDNQLSGSLPADWSKAKSLKEISLAFNGLEGKLPAEWGALQNLKVLKINSNKLTGPVPKEWAAPSKPYMASLETLTVFGNAGLTGCLPASFGGKGPSSKGFFQGPAGQKTTDAKAAAAGTKITGLCKR